MPFYEFTLSGDLDPGVVEQETGLRCTRRPGPRARGELVDRAALHGTIERMYRLGPRSRRRRTAFDTSHTVTST